MHPKLKAHLPEVPQFPQRQDSLTDQLQDLYAVACRLGMYDAADYLRRGLDMELDIAYTPFIER